MLIVCTQLVVLAEALPASTFHLGASDWKCPSWLDLVCDPVCLVTHCSQAIETCMKDKARAWRLNPPCAIRGAVSPDLDGRQTCRGSFIGAMKCMSSHSKTNFTAQNDCMVIDKQTYNATLTCATIERARLWLSSDHALLTRHRSQTIPFVTQHLTA